MTELQLNHPCIKTTGNTIHVGHEYLFSELDFTGRVIIKDITKGFDYDNEKETVSIDLFLPDRNDNWLMKVPVKGFDLFGSHWFLADSDEEEIQKFREAIMKGPEEIILKNNSHICTRGGIIRRGCEYQYREGSFLHPAIVYHFFRKDEFIYFHLRYTDICKHSVISIREDFNGGYSGMHRLWDKERYDLEEHYRNREECLDSSKKYYRSHPYMETLVLSGGNLTESKIRMTVDTAMAWFSGRQKIRAVGLLRDITEINEYNDLIRHLIYLAWLWDSIYIEKLPGGSSRFCRDDVSFDPSRVGFGSSDAGQADLAAIYDLYQLHRLKDIVEPPEEETKL